MKPIFVQIEIAIGDAPMDLESAGEMLLSAGAESAEILTGKQLRIICLETESARINLVATNLGFLPSPPTLITVTDWCPVAPELLEPLALGDLVITPLLSADIIPQIDPRSIYIVPGTGFGTGHHATTASIIKLLTRLRDGEFHGGSPARIADIGTGSGILAFAAAKLFPQAEIIATDIDPLALDNAQGNRRLNSLGAQVTFLLSEVPQGEESSFDLILANIYGEVLVSLADKFQTIASENSLLITSGIALQVEAAVQEAYRDWEILTRIEQENWVTLLFRRRLGSSK